MSVKFEQFKFNKLLRERGGKYAFKRRKPNEFGEGDSTEYLKDVDGNDIVYIIDGVYHEQNGYITVTTGETAQTRSKKKPMILCLINDETKALKKDDELSVSNTVYKITGFVDISNWGIYYDISMEVVDNG